MEKIKKVTDLLFNIVSTVAVVIIAAALICIVAGIRPYITLSGSMEPAIHTGSVCFVNTKADYEDIEVGDVISFKLETGGYTTHRVIGITEEGIETKGDNNENSDGITTTAENFHGKTLFSVPYAGYVMSYLHSPAVIAVIMVVLVAMVSLSVVDAVEERKNRSR